MCHMSTKFQADELNKWKIEEARKFEQARFAEEAALAIAETEKAKCRAAIEAAKKAQKMAEIEAQRRKYAELKAKRETEKKKQAMNVRSQNDLRYRKYTIEEIEAATKKFSNSQKIGEGGYGPVFKGKLDHTPVAIKVLSPDAAQGKKQFQQEVTLYISNSMIPSLLQYALRYETSCVILAEELHFFIEFRAFIESLLELITRDAIEGIMINCRKWTNACILITDAVWCMT